MMKVKVKVKGKEEGESDGDPRPPSILCLYSVLQRNRLNVNMFTVYTTSRWDYTGHPKPRIKLYNTTASEMVQ